MKQVLDDRSSSRRGPGTRHRLVRPSAVYLALLMVVGVLVRVAQYRAPPAQGWAAGAVILGLLSLMAFAAGWVEVRHGKRGLLRAALAGAVVPWSILWLARLAWDLVDVVAGLQPASNVVANSLTGLLTMGGLLSGPGLLVAFAGGWLALRVTRGQRADPLGG